MDAVAVSWLHLARAARTVVGMTLHRIRRLRDKGESLVDDVLADEAPLEIQVREYDGLFKSVAVVMRTPDDDDRVDEDLALGFLRTEGVVASFADVVHIGHCTTAVSADAEGNVLQVRLRAGVVVDWARLTRHTFSSSSCGVCGKATIDAVLQTLPSASLSSIAAPSAAAAAALCERLRIGQTLFAVTGGTHGAMLVVDDRLLAIREDVGRHNAVDKVIGHALRAGTDFSKTTLVVSGRIAFEIVQKAAVVGIGVIVAVGAPTSLAVALAQRAGMTLVGFVRAGRANVYC